LDIINLLRDFLQQGIRGGIMDVTIEEDELRISQNTFNLLRNQFNVSLLHSIFSRWGIKKI